MNLLPANFAAHALRALLQRVPASWPAYAARQWFPNHNAPQSRADRFPTMDDAVLPEFPPSRLFLGRGRTPGHGTQLFPIVLWRRRQSETLA